jgi:hypothetical protein
MPLAMSQPVPGMRTRSSGFCKPQMKFNPFDGVQAGDWALMDGVAARAKHASARRACFICDLLGGVYFSGHAFRAPDTP